MNSTSSEILEFCAIDKSMQDYDKANAECMHLAEEMISICNEIAQPEMICESARKINTITDLNHAIDELMDKPAAPKRISATYTILGKLAAIVSALGVTKYTAGKVWDAYTATRDVANTATAHRDAAIGKANNMLSYFKIKANLLRNQISDLEHQYRHALSTNNTEEAKELVAKISQLKDQQYHSTHTAMNAARNSIEQSQRVAEDKVSNALESGAGRALQWIIGGIVAVGLIYAGYKLCSHWAKRSAKKLIESEKIAKEEKIATIKSLIKSTDDFIAKAKTDEDKANLNSTKADLDRMLSELVNSNPQDKSQNSNNPSENNKDDQK